MKTIFDRITVFSLLLFISFAFSSSLVAQSNPNREIGIRLTNLTNFGIVHKKKKEENKFRRIRLGVANFSFASNQGRQNFNLNSSVAIGVEKRKVISERFHFITGTEFQGNLNVSLSQNSANVKVMPGVGFVLGFQYAISDRFYVSLETIPSVNVQFGIDENGFQEDIKVNDGFSSNAASLNLVYQFRSKKEA